MMGIVSLRAWWEVVAAHHQVHDYACFHLHTDCLHCKTALRPYARQSSMGTFTYRLLLLALMLINMIDFRN